MIYCIAQFIESPWSWLIISQLFLADNSTEEDLQVLRSLTHNVSDNMRWLKRCQDVGDTTLPCVCQLQLCLSWYPCDLKYCSGQDSNGKSTEYRCGIKTCGKCYDFHFHVGENRHCFWDGHVIL